VEDTSWRLFLCLSLAGIGLSGYLTAVSYVTADLSYCEPYPFLSCEAVIYSPYSRIMGVPVALIGAIGFTLLFIMAYLALILGGSPAERLLVPATVLTFAGLAFGLYLTYLELFVILSLCILCLLTFLIVVPMAVLSLLGLLSEEKAGGGTSSV
jgi:uncharacterized membrane protein